MISDVQASALARDEVVRLHDFIAGWFRGDIDPGRFDDEFSGALHLDFENVQPSGQVLSRADLLHPIQSARAGNPDFQITIEEPRLLAAWPGLILFQYVEFQTGARNSAPENRRRSTVLFERGERLVWRYLTEVGM